MDISDKCINNMKSLVKALKETPMDISKYLESRGWRGVNINLYRKNGIQIVCKSNNKIMIWRGWAICFEGYFFSEEKADIIMESLGIE